MYSNKSVRRIHTNPEYRQDIIYETTNGVYASNEYPQSVKLIKKTIISPYFNYYQIINMARDLDPHMPFKPYEPAQNIEGLGEINQSSSQADINKAIQQAIKKTNEMNGVNITEYKMENNKILETEFSNDIKILLIAMNILDNEDKRKAYNAFINNPTGAVPRQHTLHTLRKGGMRKTYRKSRRHNKISKNTKVRNNRRNRKTRSNRKTIKH